VAAPLLQVEHLTKYYPAGQGLLLSRLGRTVKAVDNVSFCLEQGEALGLVGESGCGKSTTGRCINRLLEATSGKIRFAGEDVRKLKGRELKRYRRDVSFIFQDPYASLDPRMTVAEIVTEPLAIHGVGSRKERLERAEEVLARVGLNAEHLHRYPHEFSGGQRQRVGIARALMLRPKLVICDEPVSALDMSVQAQVLNLLQELQEDLCLTYLFIAHDLAVVRHVCDRIAVMYLGKIVELGGWRDVYHAPRHPYTRSLLSAVPIPDPAKQRRRTRTVLEGEVPSPVDPPSGCRFHTRCPMARFPVCAEQEPGFREVEPGHYAACHFADGHVIDDQFTDGRAAAPRSAG
jgi:oligopeptide transport system ATP-binding protein